MPVSKICNQAKEIAKGASFTKIIDPSFKSNHLQSSAVRNNEPTLKHFEATLFQTTFLNLRG